MNQKQVQKMCKLPLPAEIIVQISNYLNIKDKLNLRLINKSFKFVFDNLIIINCLKLVDSDEYIYYNWFYTNRSNNQNDLIRLNDMSTINNLFKNDHLLRNIRKLFFATNSSINLNNTINHFEKLEELNIYDCKIVDCNPVLALPKLKILSIQCGYADGKIIELDTPLLLFVRCEELNNYEFNYAEKLIYLDTEFMYCDKGNLSDEIEKMCNLEYIILYSQTDKNEFKPNLLSKLHHLKELHFNGCYYEEDCRKLQQIYKYKLKLRLDNLKIYLYGINYDYLKKLNQDQLIFYSRCQLFELIYINYSNTIDKLSFIEYIDFKLLFQFLTCNPDISLENIVRKLPNVKCIKGHELNHENIDCFFQFISKYDYLKNLSFTTQMINKIHYLNKLPNFNQRIRSLEISDFDIDESTNLNFLYKFNSLVELFLGKIKDVGILKYLRKKEIASTIKCTIIYRSCNFTVFSSISGYRFYEDGKDKQFKELDEMIDYFDTLIDEKEE